MKSRRMSDQQFQTLYDNHLPGLYCAALCLTGDQKVAERLTAKAFLETAIVKSYAADSRTFAVESAGKLYQLCKKEALPAYSIEDAKLSGARVPHLLSGLLSKMSLFERAVIIFSIIQKFQPEETAKAVDSSGRAVRRCLRRTGRDMRMSEFPALDDLCLSFSQLF